MTEQHPDSRRHPLSGGALRPLRLNNPMGYVPHPLCREAAAEVQRYLGTKTAWSEELEKGKMFGVLVVDDGSGALAFLAAYSGQLAGRSDWDYFVPAVFDYLQADGYFKRKEAAISAINRQVEAWESRPQMVEALARLDQLKATADSELKACRQAMEAAKERRDAVREAWSKGEKIASPYASEEEMVAESQWMKAELRRCRKRHMEIIGRQQKVVDEMKAEVAQLRLQRRQKSEALQRWLFSQFRMLNARGEVRDLMDIFANTPMGVPPSGAGECCAPRLLQYAFAHRLTPVAMAEFWWGRSPVGEVREHLQFYPACRGKCLPILRHMLTGLEVEDNPYEQPADLQPEICYEDESLMVLCKPAGMLAVPGKTGAPSVYDFVKARCPNAEGPLVVHRLDMATSGLMVVAKTRCAHQLLQAQFAHRTVKKEYVALLQRPLPSGIPRQGTISLPLAADPLDRPRQHVDSERGKPAVTYYEMTGDERVRLIPHTGRTHQLRVHCAHANGLATPIRGDMLYGTPGERLFLHAEKLTFEHPVTHQVMTFTAPPEF